jgi:outer membrane protein assembly factor BamB
LNKRKLSKKFLLLLYIIFLFIPLTTGHNEVFKNLLQTEIGSVITTQTESNGGLMNSSWPMFHHDVRHTGRSLHGLVGNWPLVKWKFRMDGLTISSPAIDENNIVYIGAEGFYDKFFFAINPNGSEKWHFNPSDWVDSSPVLSSNGIVYFGSHNHYLQALWPNGTLKWMFDMSDWVFSSPTIGTNGTIYVGSFDYYFYAMNPNGTMKWRYLTGGSILSSAAIDDNGIIYFGSHDMYLYALYPNGTLAWRYKTSNRIKGSPSIGADGTIYICSWDHYLYAVAPNGTLKWKFDTGSSTETSPAIASDGTIYIGSYDGLLFSITPEGSENWRFQTGNGIYSSPVTDTYGIIYCGSYDGYLYALNPNGTLRWKFDAGDSIESSVAIGNDGTIYIAAQFEPSGGDNSYTYLYALELINNSSPSTPSIDGTTSGKIKQNYEYTIASTDPEDNNISYYVTWGDETNSGWIGPFTSGEEQTVSHTWNKKGTYTIQVKAKDNYSAESDWGTLQVTMPFSHELQHPFISWLLERFPNAFPLLRYLIGFV